MPDTLVSIGLNSPPFLCPGLGSNVSICDGPPGIHRRMHDFFRFGSFAVSAARAGSQWLSDSPDTPIEAQPSEAIRSQSRRDNKSYDIDPLQSR